MFQKPPLLSVPPRRSSARPTESRHTRSDTHTQVTLHSLTETQTPTHAHTHTHTLTHTEYTKRNTPRDRRSQTHRETDADKHTVDGYRAKPIFRSGPHLFTTCYCIWFLFGIRPVTPTVLWIIN